jgi:hypothetical protein
LKKSVIITASYEGGKPMVGLENKDKRERGNSTLTKPTVHKRAAQDEDPEQMKQAKSTNKR